MKTSLIVAALMTKRTMKKRSVSHRVSKKSKTGKPSAKPTPERVIQFVWGFAPTLILNAAVQLRVFDLLEESARTVDEVARETGSSLRGMRALLDALVGFQFLKRQGTRYTVTPESSAFLVSTKPDYHGGF